MRSLLPLALMLLLLSEGPPRAAACGGPEVASFPGLTSLDQTLRSIAMPDEEWSSWGNWMRTELRFLHPFRAEDPAGTQVLWGFAHEDLQHAPPPSTQALEAALQRGDWNGARAAALAIIDALFAMPPVLAAEHDALLWRAVEVVELHPHLKGLDDDVVADFFAGRETTSLPPVLARAAEARQRRATTATPDHPRAASLELWAIERAFRAGVPDGWARSARASLPAATWAAHHVAVDRWLARHPAHPLRDRAELFHVRIDYFAGAGEAAWTRLIALLPRRRVRALAEMRYLLLQDMPPSARQLDALTDPVLITALALPDVVTPARWNRWWKLAQTAPGRPWAQNLEERLLYALAARTMPLPASFPDKPSTRSALWGKLRAIALLQAKRVAEARAQTALVAVDGEQARIGVHAHLAAGDRLAAVRQRGVPADTRQYLLRVRLDDTDIGTLTQGSGDLAREARLEAAVRAAERGDWKAAAKRIEADDPERARLLRRAADLYASAAPTARLELARLLADHAGIFHDVDRGFYRGLSHRHADLTRAKHTREAAAIARYFERATPDWRALVLFTGWLADNEHHPDADDVLAEADAAYNRLINFGGGNYFFWGEHTKHAPQIAQLRAVGSRIRARR